MENSKDSLTLILFSMMPGEAAYCSIFQLLLTPLSKGEMDQIPCLIWYCNSWKQL